MKTKKKAHVESGLDCSAVQLLAATITAIASMAIQGIELAPIPADSVIPALTLGFVNGGFGCYLYFSSIGSLSAQTVAVCDYVEPLSAVLLASALLGEGMSALQWTGAGLVIIGAVACEIVRRNTTTPAVKPKAPAGVART